jgi:hypothetical protein
VNLLHGLPRWSHAEAICAGVSNYGIGEIDELAWSSSRLAA